MKSKATAYTVVALIVAALLAVSQDGNAARKRRRVKTHNNVRKTSTLKKSSPSKAPPSAKPQDLAAVSAYTDRRVQLWGSLALNGRSRELIASLKKDLAGKTPHPLAAHALYSALTRTASKPNQAGRIGGIIEGYDAAEYGELILPENGHIKDASASKDPIMIAYIASAAMVQYKDALAMQLITDCLYLSQDQFLTARIAFELALRNPAFRAKLIEMASPGNPLFRTPAGRYLSAMLAITPHEATDELGAVDDYLLTVPNDPGALYYRGAALASLERHKESAEALSASVNAYPFDLPGLSDRWTLYMKELAMSDRGGEIEKAALKLASTYGNSKDARRISKLTAVKANIEAGEFGNALRGLKEIGSGGDVNRLWAIALVSAGRVEEGIGRARAAVSEADNAQNKLVLSDALKADKKFEDAIKALGSKKDHLNSGTYGYYLRAGALTSRTDDNTALLRLLKEACEEHPGSAELLKDYAGALSKDGQVLNAVEALLRVVELGEPDVATTGLLRIELTKLKGAKQAEDELRKIRIAHPGVAALWGELYEQSDATDSETTLKIWKEAARLNPLKYWPLKRIVAMLVTDGQLNEAASLAQSAFLNGLTASDRAGALKDLAAIELERVRLDPADAQSTQSALKILELYSKYHGNAGAYHRLRRTALLKAGRTGEAAIEDFELFKLTPDDEGLIKTLVTQDQQWLGTRPWTALHRYVNRRPFESARLKLAAGLHARHGGSALRALELSNDLEKISREAVDEDARATAYALLGDYRAGYETRYAKARSIAPNLNAIIDFYSTSERVGANSIKVVPDYSTGIFKLIGPDGTIIERKDNPASARPEFIKSGGAYLRAQYDQEGDKLTLLESSSAERYEFNYDADARVTSIVSAGSPTMRFGYAQDASKAAHQGPSIIAMDGVGEVTLTYKPDGSLESASSSKSRDVAARVLVSFRSITEMLARFESGVLSVPEPARQSAEHLRLRSAYDKSKRRARGSSATLLKSARAGLAFADYVRRKDTGSPEAVQSAIEASVEVISSLTDSAANRIINKNSAQNAQRIDLAAQAVAVWRELTESTGRPTQEDFAFLYGALTRLDDILTPKYATVAGVKKIIKT
ncbi:MAG: hypothetical protein OEV28_10910, partial [Nitrospirota bacterium]|nr:hypothetical protein [Nitrospirota bacterium]